jgi:hypothetical protein
MSCSSLVYSLQVATIIRTIFVHYVDKMIINKKQGDHDDNKKFISKL